MFKYSLDNKRYHTLNYFYQNKFNSKVSKISLNTGFTCPNIDGTKGTMGCIYCSNGSGENKNLSIREQFEKVKNTVDKKWDNLKYIVYFQAHTNTYGPIDKIKKYCEEVLTYPGVIGISIATRADSISDEVFNYLIELNKKTYLTVELGLQTTNLKTRDLINRCESMEEVEKMHNKLKENNIDTVIHIINGLPYETETDMINTVKYVNKISPSGIKIHMLYVVKNTQLYNLYIKEQFKLLTKQEYASIVVKQLEYLDENIVLHRITGDPIEEDLLEPKWLLKKFTVLNEIDKLQKEKNSYQGKLL